MSDYEQLSEADRLLVDAQVYSNLESMRQDSGFGLDPKLAAENEETYIGNIREYFTQPDNLQRLRDNDKQRQENLAEQGIESQALPPIEKGGPKINGR